MTNFQRDGSISYSHVAWAFELRAQQMLARHGLNVSLDHKLLCGLGEIQKAHAFDLGFDYPLVIAECKSQTWTVSRNIPSAKMKNWAEAMFYFHMAPGNYRKIFFVEQSVRAARPESLLEYLRRTQAHMIPLDVEFWELHPNTDTL